MSDEGRSSPGIKLCGWHSKLMQTCASHCHSAESSLFTGGSKGVLPGPLQLVEQQATAVAVFAGQEGKGSDTLLDH